MSNKYNADKYRCERTLEVFDFKDSIVYSKEESLPASCAAGGRVLGLAAGVADELRGAAHLGPATRAAHRVKLRMRGEP